MPICKETVILLLDKSEMKISRDTVSDTVSASVMTELRTANSEAFSGSFSCRWLDSLHSFQDHY